MDILIRIIVTLVPVNNIGIASVHRILGSFIV